MSTKDVSLALLCVAALVVMAIAAGTLLGGCRRDLTQDCTDTSQPGCEEFTR